MFHLYDEDNSGSISVPELMKVIQGTQVGAEMALSEEDVRKVRS